MITKSPNFTYSKDPFLVHLK